MWMGVLGHVCLSHGAASSSSARDSLQESGSKQALLIGMDCKAQLGRNYAGGSGRS
jgi:hypothetical protein